MSADRWSTCPKCKEERDAKLEAKKQEVWKSYGKVPIEQWEAMRETYQKIVDNPGIKEPLREDWHIILSEEGALKIKYSCSCMTCGFSFSRIFTDNILSGEETSVQDA